MLLYTETNKSELAEMAKDKFGTRCAGGMGLRLALKSNENKILGTI